MATQSSSGQYRGQHKSKATRLSPQTVEAFKAPDEGRRLEINDTGCAGLRLRISSAGAKTWSVVYRVRGDGPDGKSRGAPRRASLGPYPLIDLNAARDMARIAMDDADRGIDYAKRIVAEAEQRRMLAATGGRSPNRIDVIVDHYIDNHLKTLWSSWQNADRWLKKVVVPEWREREIGSLRRADVVKLLDKVSDERSLAAAIEVRKHLSGLFNWAIATDQYDLLSNPMVGLKRKEKYQPRENKLNREQLKQVWAATGDFGYPFREMYRLTDEHQSTLQTIRDGGRAIDAMAQYIRDGMRGGGSAREYDRKVRRLNELRRAWLALDDDTRDQLQVAVRTAWDDDARWPSLDAAIDEYVNGMRFPKHRMPDVHGFREATIFLWGVWYDEVHQSGERPPISQGAAGVAAALAELFEMGHDDCLQRVTHLLRDLDRDPETNPLKGRGK